jgi:hypothetical protein
VWSPGEWAQLRPTGLNVGELPLSSTAIWSPHPVVHMRQRSTQPAPSSHSLPTGSTRSSPLSTPQGYCQHTSSGRSQLHSSTSQHGAMQPVCAPCPLHARRVYRPGSVLACARVSPAAGTSRQSASTSGQSLLWLRCLGGTRVVLPFAMHCPPLTGNREPPEWVSRAWSPGALGISVFHSCGGCESGSPACGTHEAKVYPASFTRMGSAQSLVASRAAVSTTCQDTRVNHAHQHGLRHTPLGNDDTHTPSHCGDQPLAESWGADWPLLSPELP